MNMKEIAKRKFDLQILNGDGGEGGEGGQGDGGQGDGGQSQGGNGGSGDPKPFAVFPDEASFMGRVNREAKKLQSGFLNELGVDSAEALKNIISEYNTNKTNSMSELDLANTKLADLQKERDKFEAERNSAIEQANQTLLSTEAKIKAMDLGVNPERINHLLKLADLSEVEIKDGKVDETKLNDVLSGLLEDLPEFKKAKETPPKGGGDFSGDNKDNGSELTMEQIRNMSTEEIAGRMDEVRAVMAKHQK